MAPKGDDDEEVQVVIDVLMEAVSVVAGDTERWTPEASAYIYEAVAFSCAERGHLIRDEMGD